MSMMCPPHRVKIVSTPSFFSALATRCPPEMTLASRLLRLSVSSAVVVPLLSVVLVADSSMDASIEQLYVTAGFPSSKRRAGRLRFAPEVLPERALRALPSPAAAGRDLQASARRQLRRGINGRGSIRVRAAQGLQDQNRHQRRENVEHGRRHEYRVPVSFGRHDTGERYEQRSGAFRGIHEPGV